MSPLLKEIVDAVARACQLMSVAFVAFGAFGALAWTLWRWRNYGDLAFKKAVWRRFAANIILALEFALAADIAETAFAPTWQAIGKLAAIAAIRTALNFFLERDLASDAGSGAWSPPGPLG
jgi:uncharacterized membrane protein